MIKVEYKSYRVWATLQTSGKYRAWFVNSPVTVMANVSLVIEGDTEAQAINKARKFIDGRLHAHQLIIAGRRVG